jgi:hypothetical protein
VNTPDASSPGETLVSRVTRPTGIGSWGTRETSHRKDPLMKPRAEVLLQDPPPLDGPPIFTGTPTNPQPPPANTETCSNCGKCPTCGK